jgi:hypothetical protein
MKKFLILIILFFGISEIYGQFTFGPKIGYTSSKLSTNFDTIKENAKNNFQVGAFVRFGKKLYVQPELYYATSGGKLKIEGTELEEDIKFKNLCIPVLIGYKLINAKIINLRVLAGPVANFNLGTDISSSDLITDPLQDSDFKNAAWGLDLGAGIDLFFLTLDIRYEIGLNNIYKGPDNGGDQKVKNNVFVVSLGFKLVGS